MADGLRRRNVGSSGKIGPVHDKTTIPTQNVVNYAPTRENQLKLHTLNNVGQAMIIRLALDSTSQSGTNSFLKFSGHYAFFYFLTYPSIHEFKKVIPS